MDHYEVWVYDELALWSKAGRIAFGVEWVVKEVELLILAKSSSLSLKSQAFDTFIPNWQKHNNLCKNKRKSTGPLI